MYCNRFATFSNLFVRIYEIYIYQRSKITKAFKKRLYNNVVLLQLNISCCVPSSDSVSFIYFPRNVTIYPEMALNESIVNTNQLPINYFLLEIPIKNLVRNSVYHNYKFLICFPLQICTISPTHSSSFLANIDPGRDASLVTADFHARATSPTKRFPSFNRRFWLIIAACARGTTRKQVESF